MRGRYHTHRAFSEQMEEKVMGGRGAASKLQKKETVAEFSYSRSELSAAYRKIASAPVGSVVTAKYTFGGDTVYEVRSRAGGKKQLVAKGSSRGRALTSSTSAKSILGQPSSVKVEIPVLSAQDSFRRTHEAHEQNGDRDVTSSTYERAQRSLNREVDNWMRNR